MPLLQYSDALGAFRAAISVDPHMPEAYVNLGVALRDLKMPIDAVATVIRALCLKETTETKTLFVETMEQFASLQLDDRLEATLVRALRGGWSRLAKLAAPVARHIRQKEAILPLLGQPAFAADWPRARIEEAFGVLAADSLLSPLMRAAPIHDTALEGVLTACRAALLRLVADGSTPFVLRDDVKDFFCALSTQCFLNEYVFYCSDEEYQSAERIKLSVESDNKTLTDEQLIYLASYSPLHELKNAPILTEMMWPDCVRNIIDQQVTAPLKERLIASAIPQLTAIRDGVSTSVRQQYEESPFPRWTNPSRVAPCANIGAYVRGAVRRAPAIAVHSTTPQVLIAGCGTGQHPIESALALPQGQFLAIDLSLASLSYAKRKAADLDVDNVEFAQADILELGDLGRQFDIIESVGVLHHLDQPELGLEVLLRLLKPGGLLRLGLHSRHARHSIVTAREFIAERGYSPKARDIRRFRRDLLALDPQDPRRAAARWGDFATTSECRDLLFHVQEHQLTIPEIATWLSRHSLTFLGFHVDPQTLQRFRSHFPQSDADLSLAFWDRFELENPESFSGMYQFWVQKGLG